jgi:hypothetical protein
MLAFLDFWLPRILIPVLVTFAIFCVYEVIKEERLKRRKVAAWPDFCERIYDLFGPCVITEAIWMEDHWVLISMITLPGPDQPSNRVDWASEGF